MVSIAIDGACRRNGKPDCISAGGVYTVDNEQQSSQTFALHEYNSTNQRGEMMALLQAFDFIHSNGQEAQIITDSEYLFNAITKDWLNSWEAKGWVTATMEPVKNQDLWRQIRHVHNAIVAKGIDFSMYHIKGHIVSFGKVTGLSLLRTDLTGKSLQNAVATKYAAEATKLRITGKLADVQECSIKNNGFCFEPDTLARFVAMNVVADFVATMEVEAVNAEFSVIDS